MVEFALLHAAVNKHNKIRFQSSEDDLCGGFSVQEGKFSWELFSIVTQRAESVGTTMHMKIIHDNNNS